MDELDAKALVARAVLEGAGYKVRPPSRLSSGPTGIHLGAGSGTSVDFHEFREYQPGDDLRRVDWGVYARLGTLVVRLYQMEVSPVVEILVDASASMGLYGGKSGAARFLAAFLASAARRAEGRPVLVLEDGRIAGERIEHVLGSIAYGGVRDVEVAARWPRGSGRPLRYLVSDLLFPAPMEAYISDLSRDAAALVVVQILSRTEREPRFGGSLRLVDAEDQGRRRDLRLDKSVLERYATRLAGHLASIDEACRRVRAVLVRIDVDDRVRSMDEVRGLALPPLLACGVVERA